MENSEQYRPKFDPETGLPLTDVNAEEVSKAAEAVTDEVKTEAQTYVSDAAPFTAQATEQVSDTATELKDAYSSAPFVAKADEATTAASETVSSAASDYGSGTQSAYQSSESGSSTYNSGTYQSGSSQAPFQAAPSQAPYQTTPTQAPYQAAPTQTPYQTSGTQSSYQSAPTQPTHSSGMQYSNQNSQSPYAVNQSASVGPTNTMALVSMIAGIVSVVFIFLSGSIVLGILGILSGIAAIITGTMALKQIKAGSFSSGSKGMAMAGIICGAIGLVLSLIITIACAACYASVGNLTKNAFDNLDKFSY